MVKFPKTPRLQNISNKDFKHWQKFNYVIQEKIDGANSAISFEDSKLILQSRGHILVGNPREKQFDILKRWANLNQKKLYDILGNRYILFGENMYAYHKVFYDNLPHYFLAFDTYDKEKEIFLSSNKLSVFKNNLIVYVAELKRGAFKKPNNFMQYISNSKYKTKDWAKKAPNPNEDSDLMEGVYIRIEDDEKVIGRIKIVRPEFEKIRDEDDRNWLSRPIIPNLLGPGITLDI